MQVRRGTLVLVFGVALVAGRAFGRSLQLVPGQPLVAYSAKQAAAKIVGRGANLVSAAEPVPVTAADGEVVWKTIRELADPQGRRHVFIRQYLRRPAGDVEVFGSEIGLHYSRQGVLQVAGGRQFTNVKVVNSASFTAADAQRRAIVSLAAPGAAFVPTPYEKVPPVARAYRDARATMLLVPVSATAFRYVYRVVVTDIADRAYYVMVDAETAAILDATDVAQYSNCGPATPLMAAGGIGRPVRDDITSDRWIGANTFQREEFPFEGRYNLDWTTNVDVYQEVDRRISFACNPNANNNSYTLFPAPASTVYLSMARYDDIVTHDANTNTDVHWRGRVVADAMYKTALTYYALSGLGYGFAFAKPFQVVIESTVAGCFDACASYNMNSGADSRIPPGGGVLFYPTIDSSPLYNSAASLDQVAHEWGHEFIQHTVGFPPVFGVPHQLNEGFADVIGQLVEKYSEPPGYGVEKSSDWDLGEDMSKFGYQYAFSGTTDAGEAGHNFGNYHFNLKFHALDKPSGDDHEWGNMLNVVYYLMSEGGTNPACGRLNNCNISVPGGFGPVPAGELMLRALTYYIPSSAQWEDLGAYVEWAAFDEYNNCPGGPGDLAQTMVARAFAAIGYPPPLGQRECN